MKRVLISHSSASLQKFHLVEGAFKKATLKYNHLQQSIRIVTEKNQRLFFIEKAGFWHNKTILKNEYGIETGGLVYEKGFHAGTIELEGSKHHFIVHDNPLPELIIYQQDMSAPLIVCNMAADKPEVSFHHYTAAEYEHACILLGLCWYLVPRKTTEQVPEPELTGISVAG